MFIRKYHGLPSIETLHSSRNHVQFLYSSPRLQKVDNKLAASAASPDCERKWVPDHADSQVKSAASATSIGRLHQMMTWSWTRNLNFLNSLVAPAAKKPKKSIESIRFRRRSAKTKQISMQTTHLAQKTACLAETHISKLVPWSKKVRKSWNFIKILGLHRYCAHLCCVAQRNT